MEIPRHVLISDEIDLLLLCHTDPEFAHELVGNACLYASLLSKKLIAVPKSLLLHHFPSTSHANKLVSVAGTVVKQGQVLLNNVRTEHVCIECNEVCFEESVCENCGCTYTAARQVFTNAVTTQKIRIQNIGCYTKMSETLEIEMNNEHAGKFFPGERIVVTGMVSLRLNNPKVCEKMFPSLFVSALHVSVEENEKKSDVDEDLLEEFGTYSSFAKRKFLLDTFAPEMKGWLNVKLGFLLAIAKGASTERRSNIHILLVGDTGTGKTNFMHISAKYIYPSIIVNGIGTTDAGLTTCAVRQGGDWTLEAGALVLADMGLCFVDEIESLRTNDRSGLLEAMEQQTLSVAKAGLVSTLNARCSVVGTCNSKFKYECIDDLVHNNSLGTPLISRFDLIFGMFDDRDRDSEIVDSVLSRKSVQKSKDIPGTWNANVLTSYLQAVRGRRAEIEGPEKAVLLKYYNHKRKIARESSEYLTIRMLEGLMRLTEAHSKLLLKERVDADDAITSIILVESCLGTKKIHDYTDEIFTNEIAFEDVKKKILEVLK